MRQYKRADYAAAWDQTVTIREVLPPDHLARFVAKVLVLLDLSAFYDRYGAVGGVAYAPEVLLGLLRNLEHAQEVLEARVQESYAAE